MIKLMTAMIAVGLSLIAGGAAWAQSRTEIGVLNCVVERGTGFIIGSRKQLSCSFDPADGVVGVRETYTGEIAKYGLDIGVTEQTLIKCLVLAPTTAYPAHALAGTYVGASGEVTLGVGLGANVLVGGSNDTFALQPISVQAVNGGGNMYRRGGAKMYHGLGGSLSV